MYNISSTTHIMLIHKMSTISLALMAAALLCLLLQLGAEAAAAVARVTCTKDLKELEDNGLKLVGYMYLPQYSYPTKEVEFKAYCKNIKEGEQYVKAYASKCLDGASKTASAVFAYTASRTNRKYCVRNGKSRAEMRDFAKCANKHKLDTKKCFDSFMDGLNVTNTIVDPKKRIPYICCLGSTLRSCISTSLEGRLPECTTKVINNYGSFVDQIFNNIMNVVCDGDEDNSDRCNKMFKLPKVQPTRISYRTIFPFIFEIFDKL